MDYEQAEREFQRIEAMHQAGSIGEEAYRAQLNALRVTDEYGRTWMLQERTGQWFVYHEGQWVASTPPGKSAAAPSAQPSPVSKTAGSLPNRPNPMASVRQRPGCFSVTLRIMLWTAVWLGAAWVVNAFVPGQPLWAYLAVGLGALATLVLWGLWMTRHGRAARKLAQGDAR